MVNISLITESDIPEVEALCRRAFQQMDYTESRGYVYDGEHIKAVLARGIKSGEHILTKYMHKNAIFGVMVVGVTDFSFYTTGQKSVYEIVWHADPRLSRITQARVMMDLAADMIDRIDDHTIFGLTLDVRHLEVMNITKRLGFEEATRGVIRRNNHG